MVIRDALAGHDLLVPSPTGSGRTLAFGIPLVDLIDPRERDPQALVLAPTRELAGQIVDELSALAKARRLRIAVVDGGVGFGPQIKAAGRADILVATPGRLEDLVGRGAVALGRVKVLVLDEADRMLDMGFRPAVDRIVALTPGDRQTLFFSATLEGAAGRVATSYTHDAGSHTHTDAPEDREAYVHRVGRTGRAGRTGTGISFVLAEQSEEMRRIGASLGLAHGLGGPDRTGPSGAARRRRTRRRRPRTAA